MGCAQIARNQMYTRLSGIWSSKQKKQVLHINTHSNYGIKGIAII
jgi:hypothetical protein